MGDSEDWELTESGVDNPGITESDLEGAGFTVPQAPTENTMLGQDDDTESIPTESVPDISGTVDYDTSASQVTPYITDANGNIVATAPTSESETGYQYSESVTDMASELGISPSQINVDSNGDPISYTDANGNLVTLNTDGSTTTTAKASGTSTVGSILSALTGGSGASSSKSSTPASSKASTASTGSLSTGITLPGGSSTYLLLGAAALIAFFAFSGKKG